MTDVVFKYDYQPNGDNLQVVAYTLTYPNAKTKIRSYSFKLGK